jgi:hypothetical protein
MKKLLYASIIMLVLAFAPAVWSQTQGGVAPGPAGRVGYIFLPSPTVPDAEADTQPIPRLPDGTVDITGPWVGAGSNVDIEREGGMEPGELPLLPWARELRESRGEEQEPYTICLPMGVPRANPYPWKFAMSYTPKGLTHIYVLHETGDAGAHRVIHMDGREHPEDPIPTWFGHSIGRWEDDTLVVDTVGYNDKFWMDSRGTPHTEQLHTVERYTRASWGSLRHVFLLDDPGAFSRPVTMEFRARLLRPDLTVGGGELMEFICAENNQYGSASDIDPGTGTNIK